jgi:hypothetical protein
MVGSAGGSRRSHQPWRNRSDGSCRAVETGCGCLAVMGVWGVGPEAAILHAYSHRRFARAVPEYRGCRDSRPHTCRSPARRAFGTSTTTRTSPVSTCRWLPERSRRMEVEFGGSKAPLVCGRVAVALTGWRRPGRNSWIWRERLGLGRSHRRQSFTPPGGVP